MSDASTATAEATPPEPKLSKVEAIKEASRQLRGTLAEELRDGNSFFSEDNTQLLKFHGMYQQDDRDLRHEKNEDGTPKGKAFMMMIRSRVPGGRLTAKQFLAHLDLCDSVGNGTLRITTRQAFQLHGVLKDDVKTVLRTISESGLTTIAACGDVNRNVMSCPAPIRNNPIRDDMQKHAFAFAEHVKPRTTAYCEVWLKDDSGEDTKVAEFVPVEEPIYGKTYLPRKFKTGFALPEDNCIDIHTQDLGYLAIVEGGKLVGYNVLVGGGMGTTPSAKKTFPHLGQPMCFITPDQVNLVGESVIKVQRDHGNRSDRKVARLKYLIASWGVAKFKEHVEAYVGHKLPDPKPVFVTGVDDHIGWHPQGDGRWFLGINIENGRIKDEGTLRIKTGLRAVLNKFDMECRLTALQAVLLCDVAEKDKPEIDRILREHGIKQVHELTLLRRYSIACPAWPTCGLAVTESERALPGIIDTLEPVVAELGLAGETISVHMTGCPNGCARPYTPDIGLVGKAAGEKYTMFLGGNAIGTRLAFLYRDMVQKDDIVPTLRPVLAFFRDARNAGETFGDFCHRQGKEAIEARVAAGG
jgi:sulfite reductase (ferredoxin)